MSIIETIKIRRSCRTFSDRPVEPDTRGELLAFLETNSHPPFSGKIRFQLLDIQAQETKNMGPLGTYGVIKGARLFIAGAVSQHPKAMEDYGYCMEENILKAASLGLGTCWLGGTFSRSGFARRMNLAGDELLPAVSPVGYPGDKRSLTDRLFRFTAGSDHRKPWAELFHDRGPDTPLSEASAGRYKTPLACVRLAPSASNKQPWRIVKDQGLFHFYLRRTPGYDKISKGIRLQNIDLGIAMCHFERSAREIGLNGTWTIDGPQRPPGDMEYIVSWMARD